MSNFAGYIDSDDIIFTGEFEYEGSVGPAGYTPQRGIDYWTEEDVTTIESEVQAAVNLEHGSQFDKIDGVEAGAQVNVIEDIKVNNVSQEIVNKSVNISVPTNNNQLTNGAGYVTKTVKNLNYYTKTEDSARKIVLSINSSNYVMTASLLTSSSTEISSSSIDLPLESMVVNAEYDSATKEIVLTLQNGNTVRFSVADLVSGLVPDDRTIAGVDLVDDITKNEMLTALNVEDGSQANVLEGVQVDGTDLEITNKKVNITGMATQAEYEQLLDQIPTATTTGETINVNDSSNLPLKDVGIKGNTGKNLFDKASSSMVIAGYINSSNKFVRPNNNTRSILVPCLPNTTYTMSKIATDRFRIGYINTASINVNDTVSGVTTDHTATSITITTGAEAKSIICYIWENNGDYSLQDVLDSIQVEKSETATTYEAYYDVTGDNTVKLLGKNVFDGIMESGTINTSGGKSSSDTATRSKNYISIMPNTRYILSSVSGNSFIRLYVYDKNQQPISTVGNPFTAPQNAYFCRFAVSSTDTTSKYQLEVTTSNTATTYEPYVTPQSVTLPLGDTHLGLADSIVNDNGVWKLNGTEITDTALINALENLQKVTTNKNITNIFTVTTGANPTLEVVYRKDLETLFGNLTSAILSLGNNV